MIFIESPVFTRQIEELLGDESYAELQWFLATKPNAGDVVQPAPAILAQKPL